MRTRHRSCQAHESGSDYCLPAAQALKDRGADIARNIVSDQSDAGIGRSAHALAAALASVTMAIASCGFFGSPAPATTAAAETHSGRRERSGRDPSARDNSGHNAPGPQE